MNRKRAIAPWSIALVSFAYIVVVLVIDCMNLFSWDFIQQGIVSLFHAVCLFTFAVAIVLKGFGIFSNKFADKIIDRMGNIVLLVACICAILYSSYWIVLAIYEMICLEDFVLAGLAALNISLLFTLIYVFLLFVVIGSCMCKKEDSKLRNIAKNLWFFPAVFYFLYYIVNHICYGSALYIGNIIYMMVYIHAILALGLMLRLAHFKPKERRQPVKQAYTASPAQPTYTQPVQQTRPVYTPPVQQAYPTTPVRPAYTQPVQPARPVYTPPVQPAPSVSQQQAKVTADANSQAQALEIYKDLLDKGTITQEDYDKKKKEILGI